MANSVTVIADTASTMPSIINSIDLGLGVG